MSNDEQTAAGAAAAEPAPVADVEAIAQDPTDAEPAMAEAVRAGRAVAALADAVLAEDSQTAAAKAAAPEASAPAEAQPAAVRESPDAHPLPISVGRIVLVQIGDAVMPGIVSRVHNQHVLGVHVCVPRPHNPVVYYDPVRYDAAGGSMTWRWPPRV